MVGLTTIINLVQIEQMDDLEIGLVRKSTK